TPRSSSPVMAARQLLYALDPTDQIALAGFDDHYFGVVAFTTDHALILRGFSELQPFGSTALHDALGQAASDLATHGEGRRAVVVITDGVDTASHRSAEDVIARPRARALPVPEGRGHHHTQGRFGQDAQRLRAAVLNHHPGRRPREI